jgi:preprotein translocase subunit YajC
MIRAMFDVFQAAPTPAGGGLLAFAPMIFIFVIFYFLLIAPMRKKQKKAQEMLANLKKGDEVVTTGGIFGRIAAIDEERGFLVLEISSNVKVKVQRGAIAGLAADPEKTAP